MKFVCAVLLLCALPAQGQPVNASRVALYGGIAFDLTTTEIALRRGYRESNPVLGQSAARRLPIAIGTTAILDLVTHRMSKRHPKLITTFNFTIGGGHVGSGMWNLTAKRKQ